MLLIGIADYNLIQYLSRRVSKTAKEEIARLKTLRLKALAIPFVYGTRGRRPTLRLGMRDHSLRGKIRFWLQRIRHLDWRLSNGIAVGVRRASRDNFGGMTGMK